MSHFRGLTWRDVRALELRDFNALVEQMSADIDAQEKEHKRASRGRTGGASSGGEKRVPVMT